MAARTCCPLGSHRVAVASLLSNGKTPAVKLSAELSVLSRWELRTSVLKRWKAAPLESLRWAVWQGTSAVSCWACL
jgi:hypothetical protein